MMEWTKCSDQLPNINQKVISYNGEYIAITYFESHSANHLEKGEFWFNLLSSGCGCCDTDQKNVIAWMPLPNPPKE